MGASNVVTGQNSDKTYMQAALDLETACLDGLYCKYGVPGDPAKRTECVECGESSTKFCCARCKKIRYCSKDCQKQDWATHRTYCQTLESQADFLRFKACEEGCGQSRTAKTALAEALQKDNDVTLAAKTSSITMGWAALHAAELLRSAQTNFARVQALHKLAVNIGQHHRDWLLESRARRVQVAASSMSCLDENAENFLERCQKMQDPTAQVKASFQAARAWVTPCNLAGPVSSPHTHKMYNRGLILLGECHNIIMDRQCLTSKTILNVPGAPTAARLLHEGNFHHPDMTNACLHYLFANTTSMHMRVLLQYWKALMSKGDVEAAERLPKLVTDRLIPHDQQYTQCCIANAYESQLLPVYLARAAKERGILLDMLLQDGRPFNETCSICLKELRLRQPSKVNSKVVVLTGCMHSYHFKCIQAWGGGFQLNKFCPICHKTLAALEDMESSEAYIKATAEQL